MGRKKSYDEAEVIQKAMEVFWKNGYEDTSMRDLEKDMGINQFSIYSSFKSKEELFKKSLLCYQENASDIYLSKILKEDSTLDDVVVFLKRFAFDINSGIAPNGCLMVNSTFEIGNHSPEIQELIKCFFQQMKECFRRTLKNSDSSSTGLSEEEYDRRAQFLVAVAQSVSITAKVNPLEDVNGYIDFAMNKLV